ncbi:SCP2 sterol-binding domain-containing protein [Pukyongiella litopenaei]|uniref:SCP2 sterol-binding domain-containing protein n=1 Tax=Pukyongiella litopenaei TaxID=2605946 RepID=A0A2S0MUK6_9RHOB|nr:SCP2 sterol-binding domain-containing protein [Pukyongiella litopenaei]AVO39579.1 SCP2 sterol-binding domain-containing protein [Pukyongiella litopenaei]
MSDILEQAVAELGSKAAGADLGGSAKFAIDGVGAIMLDDNGARIGDEEADVTMTADADTFHSIFTGDLNPTGAFMSGKLTIDGDMGLAMKLASVLA